MITANDFPIKPTIFPDGTSQVWKLPPELVDSYEVSVTWQFENEREIIDLLSLRRLLYSHPMSLFVPYLPYARQDKRVQNDRTFNLEVLADLLNGMRLSEVKSLDVHNPKRAARLIKNFRNDDLFSVRHEVVVMLKPDLIVFPDEGAAQRYDEYKIDTFFFVKERDPRTGDLSFANAPTAEQMKAKKCALILDDICDGGGTFIEIAKRLHAANPDVDVQLYVTHGIFSRGAQVLRDAGITVRCYRELNRPKGTPE